MQNILVLGASGFIGSKLVEKISMSKNVIGYDRSGAKNSFVNKQITGDFCTEKHFENILYENEDNITLNPQFYGVSNYIIASLIP